MTPADPFNDDPAEMMLGKLAAMDLSAAQRAHASLMEAEEPKDVAEMAKAYARLSRCVRQSVALHSQLKRARIADERAHPAPPPKADLVRATRRAAEVRRAVCRVIWDETEAESEDEETLLAILDNALNLRAQVPHFYECPLDDEVLAVCAALRLPLDKAEGWRDLPDLSDDRPDRWRADLQDDADEDDEEDDEAGEDEPLPDPSPTAHASAAHPAAGAGPAVHSSA
jgi:hypothetical protein